MKMQEKKLIGNTLYNNTLDTNSKPIKTFKIQYIYC